LDLLYNTCIRFASYINMSAGNIGIKLRPIKLGFLVNPTDKKALTRAIEINSMLWGGSYNPIIPVFQRLPASWKKNHEGYGFNAKKIQTGYVEAFDPDFLVPLGKCKGLDFSYLKREIVNENDIDSKAKEEGTIGYGVGIFEVLQDFYDKEIKFVRKYPLKLCLFDFSKAQSLFFSSIFGLPNKDIDQVIRKEWATPLGAEIKKVDFENYASLIKELSLRKVLNHTIEQSGNFGWRGGECIFLMDANNNHDIIDYWNLRAIGWKVFPVPIQAVGKSSVIKGVEKFIERYSGVSRHNKDIYYHCSIIKSRNVPQDTLKKFADKLKPKADEGARGSRFSLQHWYPRIWDEWARDKDGVTCCELEAGSKELELNNCADEITTRTVDADFAARFTNYDAPRYANDVTTTNYCHDDLYADVIPEGGENLTRELSHVGFREWRFSRRTATYLTYHKNWHIYLKIPKAEDVFIAWMKDNGFEIKLSAPGRIAKQMIKQLGGVYGINTLANDEMLSLLKRMEPDKDNIERELHKNDFWASISKIANTKSYKREPSELLEIYIKNKIFQLGVKVKCNTCSHNSWYDINSLKYKIQCPNCLEEFDIPSHSPDDIAWAYRTIGPFRLPKRAEGVYSTLLTLRVFATQFHHSPVTPMLSFETNLDGKDCEIDLGLFFRKDSYGKDEDARLILAECKTENDFEKKDVDKMQKLADKFPGAILVFATLKDDLNAKEVKLLKPLVNRCRRYYKTEEPYNPVMILTKTELFSEHGLTYAWKDKGGKHAPFGDRHFYSNELLGICDVTQQIYLGMKPWGVWINEKFEQRRNKRKLKSNT